MILCLLHVVVDLLLKVGVILHQVIGGDPLLYGVLSDQFFTCKWSDDRLSPRQSWNVVIQYPFPIIHYIHYTMSISWTNGSFGIIKRPMIVWKKMYVLCPQKTTFRDDIVTLSSSEKYCPVTLIRPPYCLRDIIFRTLLTTAFQSGTRTKTRS